MDNDLPFTTRPATSADILENFRARHQATKWDSNFAHYVRDLTPDSNVDALHIALEESSSPKRLAKKLVGIFGLDMRPEELASSLTPMKSRRLDELCELIAGKTRIPLIEPYMVIGCTSLSIGSFRFLRRSLCVDRRGSCFRPSTPLSGFRLRRQSADRVIDLITLMAPRLGSRIETIPTGRSVSVVAWVGAVISGGMIFVSLIGVGLINKIFGDCETDALPAEMKFLPLLFLFLASLFLWAGVHLSRFDWVALRHRNCSTFGDLARAIAAYESPASSE